MTVARSPAVWALVDRLVYLLAGTGVIIVSASCAILLIESKAAIDRARARALLIGTTVAACGPLALESRSLLGLPGAAFLVPLASLAAIPAAMAYSIARYDLLEPEWPGLANRQRSTRRCCDLRGIGLVHLRNWHRGAALEGVSRAYESSSARDLLHCPAGEHRHAACFTRLIPFDCSSRGRSGSRVSRVDFLRCRP